MDDVWCADITYIPMEKGHAYLVAIMDWHSRTGKEWISELQKQGIQISMDGRGRLMDNVFIERLWRSLKYEKLHLWIYQSIPELRDLTADWIDFYNHRRKHQTPGYSTPWSIYQASLSQAA